MKKGDKIIIIDNNLYTPRFYIGQTGVVDGLGINANCRWVNIEGQLIHFHEDSLRIYYTQIEQIIDIEKSL